jgi:hypothetical protein
MGWARRPRRPVHKCFGVSVAREIKSRSPGALVEPEPHDQVERDVCHL